MNAPGSPLPGALKATPNALTARKRKRGHDIESGQLLENDLTIGALVSRQRMKAGHMSEAVTAAHGGRCHIGGLGAFHVLFELFGARLFVDRYTTHGGFSWLKGLLVSPSTVTSSIELCWTRGQSTLKR